MNPLCPDAATGRLDGRRHHYPVRVYYEDTDAAGVVYHSRYLHFLERARTEMLRCLGMPHAQMVADFGTMFALRRCELDFIGPARLDDSLEIETGLVELRGASLCLGQTIRRGSDHLVEAVVRLACITASGRPARMPAVVSRHLRRLLPPMIDDQKIN